MVVDRIVENERLNKKVKKINVKQSHYNSLKHISTHLNVLPKDILQPSKKFHTENEEEELLAKNSSSSNLYQTKTKFKNFSRM